MTVAPEPTAAIKTPCIKVCVVDGQSGLCMGCYRKLSEVAGWSKLTNDQRDLIMTELPARRSWIAPVGPLQSVAKRNLIRLVPDGAENDRPEHTPSSLHRQEPRECRHRDRGGLW